MTKLTLSQTKSFCFDSCYYCWLDGLEFEAIETVAAVCCLFADCWLHGGVPELVESVEDFD